MIRLKIIQDIEETVEGSIGALLVNDLILCWVLTPDSMDKYYHLVPGIVYKVTRVLSPKFGDTFEVVVTGHTHIFFHWGTTEKDTHGCIITGMKVGTYKGKRAVYASKKAFKKLMKLMGDTQETTLEVTT